LGKEAALGLAKAAFQKFEAAFRISETPLCFGCFLDGVVFRRLEAVVFRRKGVNVWGRGPRF
jgi:hypothetical protein